MKTSSPRFVLAIAAYREAFPDMPDGLPVCIYDRAGRGVVLTLSDRYASVICLDTTREPGEAPFTALVEWLNNTTPASLASEIGTAKQLRSQAEGAR
jgi:hypothetical protein